MQNIYFVFSSTPYKIGRIIRRVTHGKYNHVSIALAEDLTEMYSFARRHFSTPFYGGFVKESLSRYHVFGKASRIKVCRLPVTQAQYDALSARLAAMYRQKEHYLYNHFSVLASPLLKKVSIPDTYTCVEFAAEVLQQLGWPMDLRQFLSVADLERLLEEFEIYTGPVPEAKDYDEEFFAKKPVPPFTTLRSLEQLCSRLGK